MAEVNWKRIFAISSLIFAFLLVCGSIYLHLRQKHHLGRLHHENQKEVLYEDSVGVENLVEALPIEIKKLPKVEEETEFNESLALDYVVENFDSYEEDSSENWALDEIYRSHSDELRQFEKENDGKQYSISEMCLQCICETTTECRMATCTDNEPCGVFRISCDYWKDAGSPKLSGDKSPYIGSIFPCYISVAYKHCVNNAYCAARTVSNFVERYSRDCNKDGIIDCRDHIALHILGAKGCMQHNLSPLFESRMEKCLAKFV